jgi:DnaK suppressor protein
LERGVSWTDLESKGDCTRGQDTGGQDTEGQAGPGPGDIGPEPGLRRLARPPAAAAAGDAGHVPADDGTEDIVDRANNSYNRELWFSLSDSERQLLLQIDDALRRMDDGRYGHCSSCGRPINLKRLEAIPWARFCVDCQELAEKGMLEAEAS